MGLVSALPVSLALIYHWVRYCSTFAIGICTFLLELRILGLKLLLVLLAILIEQRTLVYQARPAIPWPDSDSDSEEVQEAPEDL